MTPKPSLQIRDDEREKLDRVLTQDEVSTFPCPGCGTELEKSIPAGTTERMARLFRHITFTCEECGAAETAVARQREHEAIRRKNEQTCMLPPELRGLTWDGYDTGRKGAAGALAAAQAWSRGLHEKRGLFIVGPVGVGKTRLAATACWAALGDYVDPRRKQIAQTAAAQRGDEPEDPIAGIAVTYVNVAELIVKLQAGFGDKDRAEALRILTGKGAIVLDDLDKLNVTQTVLAHLYAAVDGRVQSGAPMIVTTNLPPQALLRKLSNPGRNDDADERRVMAESIVSRLLGHCTVHGIEGNDVRRFGL